MSARDIQLPFAPLDRVQKNPDAIDDASNVYEGGAPLWSKRS